MDRNSEMKELSVADVDQIAGGFVMGVVKVIVARLGSTTTVPEGPAPQGGQNEPSQMFQQILQQLTQGQG